MTPSTAAHRAYHEKDYATARRLWIELAHGGDAEAMFWLGELHYRGRGVDKDRSVAFQWYKHAADIGCSKAYYPLGHAYLNAQGAPADYTLAVKWLQESIRSGQRVGDARYCLGRCYARGEGVRRDHAKALNEFRSAAAEGSADACAVLGAVLERGYLVSKDLHEAAKWYGLAAEKQDERAKGWMRTYYTRTVAEATVAIRRDPRSPQPYKDRCLAHIGLRQFDRAFQDADAVLPFAGYTGWAYETRAFLFEQSADWPNVISDASLAIQHEPLRATAYVRRAFGLEKSGTLSLALADYERALALDRSNDYAARGVQRLRSSNPP